MAPWDTLLQGLMETDNNYNKSGEGVILPFFLWKSGILWSHLAIINKYSNSHIKVSYAAISLEDDIAENQDLNKS